MKLLNTATSKTTEQPRVQKVVKKIRSKKEPAELFQIRHKISFVIAKCGLPSLRPLKISPC